MENDGILRLKFKYRKVIAELGYLVDFGPFGLKSMFPDSPPEK